jgi:hypothetical protein
MVEPNADERERAMGFPTGTTNVHGILEQQQRFLLGQGNGLELSHIECFFGSSGTEAISLYFDWTHGFL